jgi:hypothetical protein
MDDFKLLSKGSPLRVSGTVQKLIKRDGQCKLVIQSLDRGEIIFADCYQSRDLIAARKIRKGSAVVVRGKVSSFGLSAVCLADCKLM